MMRKRITLAKRLLATRGILVVTIDENEVDHLAVLLREVFPKHLHKRLSIVINPKGAGKRNFGRMEEYALFVIPDTGESEIHANYLQDLASKIEEDNESSANEKKTKKKRTSLNKDEKWDKPFPIEEAEIWELRHARRRGNESSYRHQRPNQFYPIYIDEKNRKVVRVGDSIPKSKAPDFRTVDGLTPIWPIDHDGNHRCWRFIPSSMQRRIDDAHVVLGKFNKKKKTWTINIWEKSAKKKLVKTVWWNPRHDAGTHGTSLLHEFLGRRDAFPFAKSLYSVVDTLSTSIIDKPDALILDFFAGSGTTAHAVSLINARYGGQRRSIMVSNNEPGEKVAASLARKGLFPGDPEFESNGICESVTWPRCKAMITGKRADGKSLEGTYIGNDNNGDSMSFKDGLEENMEYFRLDFLDSSDVERGDAFEGVLPILWMMAGCIGERENRRGSTPFYIAQHSPFAVLIKEGFFAEFAEKLTRRNDISHIFLVTDSEENFALMRRELGSSYRCYQLYKSYLENFRLNAADPTLTGEKA